MACCHHADADAVRSGSHDCSQHAVPAFEGATTATVVHPDLAAPMAALSRPAISAGWSPAAGTAIDTSPPRGLSLAVLRI